MDEKTEAQGSETTVSRSQQWETVRRGFPAMSVWLTDLALAVTVSRWAIPKPSSGLQHLPSCLGSSVQFSHSVVSDSLWPHGLQHSRPPCPSPAPKVTQTHVHQVGDAIQPSHPLSSLSPPTFNLSQHQGLYQWVSSSHQVAKLLELQLQPQSFHWILRVAFL